MDTREHVILVDEMDRRVGVAEKLAAHQNGGRLHRAFSIFLFDSNGALLLQQRADCKYHFPGLWSNTCCGHPRPGESLIDAAVRRLNEEFGIAADLEVAAHLVYRADDPTTRLTEQEYLHILTGRSDAPPRPVPTEIADYRRARLDAIDAELRQTPDRFTPWFPIALEALRNSDNRPRARD